MALAVQGGLRVAGILVNLARAQAAYDRFQNVREAVAYLRHRANMWGGARQVRKMPYRPRDKRPRRSANEEANNKLGGSTVAVGQAAHYTQSSSKYGRTVGSYGPKALQRMVKLSLQSSTYRFQSMTSLLTHTAGEFSKDLSVKCNVAAGVTASIDLPMYCFNLSSTPSNGEIFPFYRAQKVTPGGVGLSPVVNNYQWVVESGEANTKAGALSATWYLETAKDPPTVASEYRHDWSSVEMLFNCAKHNPCTIHVALVRFDNEVGPVRKYWSGSENANYDDVLAPDSIEQSEIDVFWESFWAPRIVHPLSSFKNPVKKSYIKFLKHEKIIVNDVGLPFEGGSGIPENPTMHLKKLFYNNGRSFNLTTSKASDTVNANVVPPVAGNAAGEFGTVAHGYNTQITENSTALFPDRDKDTWLLVWADHYPDPSGGVLNPMLKHCTFDFRVRSKFTQMV